jgi:hypothetical protein
MGKFIDVSHSSETQSGSLVEAELGGVSKVPLLVTQGVEFAQAIFVVEVHPGGNAGATTASKFSEHCATVLVAETLNTIAVNKKAYSCLISKIWLIEINPSCGRYLEGKL